ncbi:MAG: FAD-binding oxidoreductase [Chloroflexota bacterium]|nr:FAD-binding oxidoreductase [Chloroflexota bacterium]
MSELLSRLIDVCGSDRVSDKIADRICYTRDCGPSPGGIPDYIVQPRSAEEVSGIIEIANEHCVPIFIWGRSTTFIGNGIRKGCILMAMNLMDEIEKVDLENKVVIVQPGAVWHSVDVELNKLGWELGVPGPGGMFSCSIGGSVAYNAVPHALAEYGMTGEHVIGLEVVLPDGTIINTGSGANEPAGHVHFERYANGPDLTGLFIGSCGVLGAITKIAFRIRRVPEVEEFAFYGFDSYEQAVDAAHAIQRQDVATHLVGLFGGPKPVGYEQHDAFLHIIVRDSRPAARERRRVAGAICESFNGHPLDDNATRLYWTGHMYSWLRNYPPDHYYGNRPFMCPEVAGFMPTEKVKDAIAYLRHNEVEYAKEFEQHEIRVKCYDVYFSNNAAFIWIDTLYPELDDEAWKYGLALRSRYTDELCRRYMSPGGILQAIAPQVMTKLGPGFELIKLLKQSMDPNYILNPGVLYLEQEVNDAYL